MRRVDFFLIIAILSSVCCHIGCDRETEETALIEQNVSDEEVLTRQKLYETADWETRWERSRKARKRYFLLKDKYPEAAINAYIEYRNWMDYGHPLAEKVGRISAETDILGKINIPQNLQLLNWELQIAKDTGASKEFLAEMEENILFWTELGEDLESEGHDPALFEISFEIQEKTETKSE